MKTEALKNGNYLFLSKLIYLARGSRLRKGKKLSRESKNIMETGNELRQKVMRARAEKQHNVLLNKKSLGHLLCLIIKHLSTLHVCCTS